MYVLVRQSVREAIARQFDGWYRLEMTKRLLLCSCARREGLSGETVTAGALGNMKAFITRVESNIIPDSAKSTLPTSVCQQYQMKCSRLSCVVLAVAAQCAAGFLVTGNHALLTPAVRHRESTSRAAAEAPSQRGISNTLTMGAAGKKRKKLEKEAMKSAGGASKALAREAQKEAEVLSDGLLAKCAESKRDLAAISASIAQLRSRMGALKPALSADLGKDWRLVFASDDDAISVVGTGLHKLPLTRMQDFFMTLSGGSVAMRQIQSIEVLRVLGPFPNLRNTLTGDSKSTGPSSLNIRYTSMIDGTGKETGSSAGDKDRLVDCEVAFVGQGALVLETTTGKEMKVGYLVFAEEPDMAGELAKLRVQGDKKKES